MSGDGGKGDARRPGKGFDPGFDLIRGKLDDPLKCERCGARLDDECVCMPTDDGPGQSGETKEDSGNGSES